jgi:hypothetical protein
MTLQVLKPHCESDVSYLIPIVDYMGFHPGTS